MLHFFSHLVTISNDHYNLIIGAQDLMDLTRDRTKVMLVGITCGLSAPYVAGQVDYAMQKVLYAHTWGHIMEEERNGTQTILIW